MVSRARLGLLPCLLIGVAVQVAQSQTGNVATYRQWVQEMKLADRGPFSRIRWFCKDGTIHEPRPYACGDRGGGAQHGEWTDKVKQMRAAGYRIANIYEDLDIAAFVTESAGQ